MGSSNLRRSRFGLKKKINEQAVQIKKQKVIPIGHSLSELMAINNFNSVISSLKNGGPTNIEDVWLALNALADENVKLKKDISQLQRGKADK